MEDLLTKITMRTIAEYNTALDEIFFPKVQYLTSEHVVQILSAFTTTIINTYASAIPQPEVTRAILKFLSESITLSIRDTINVYANETLNNEDLK